MANLIKKKFIGNNEVDGAKILLEQGQSIRIKDSTGTEVELVKLGASDEVIVNGSEVSLKSDLDQEIIDRANGDAAVSAALDQEILDRIAADNANFSSLESYVDQEVTGVDDKINQEIADRIAGDSSLQSQIDLITGGGSGSLSAVQSELDATQSGAGLSSSGQYSPNGGTNYLQSAVSLFDADLVLDSTLKDAKDEIAQEVSDRIAGDAALDTFIVSSVSQLVTMINDGDSSTLVAANINTSFAISAEASDRQIGDTNTLLSANSYTDSQIALAQGEVSAVEAALAQEILDRTAADVSLQTQINNVLSNVDGAALDSLTEIVDAFQAADASLNGAITSLSTGLSADIDAEEAARIAADSALQGEIDAEEIARAAADVTLQNNINAEQSARIAADSALDVRVGVLEAVVWVKEKFSIVNGQTSVTLGFTPKANSMTAFVDRLAIHEGAAEDFTISGTTMTFLNDLVSPGQSQIGNGDTVYVKYQK
jgi:hypothetical protein